MTIHVIEFQLHYIKIIMVFMCVPSRDIYLTVIDLSRGVSNSTPTHEAECIKLLIHKCDHIFKLQNPTFKIGKISQQGRT